MLCSHLPLFKEQVQVCPLCTHAISKVLSIAMAEIDFLTILEATQTEPHHLEGQGAVQTQHFSLHIQLLLHNLLWSRIVGREFYIQGS